MKKLQEQLYILHSQPLNIASSYVYLIFVRVISALGNL